MSPTCDEHRRNTESFTGGWTNWDKGVPNKSSNSPEARALVSATRTLGAMLLSLSELVGLRDRGPRSRGVTASGCAVVSGGRPPIVGVVGTPASAALSFAASANVRSADGGGSVGGSIAGGGAASDVLPCAASRVPAAWSVVVAVRGGEGGNPMAP